MPGARIPIDELPAQTTITDTDLLVVQNGAVTKNMAVGQVRTTFTPTKRGMVPPPGTPTGTNYLRDDGVWATPITASVGIDAEAAVDAVAAALTEGNNIDISYNDAANQIVIAVEPLTVADISGLTGAAVMGLPVAISNGGTGATSQSAALSALGAASAATTLSVTAPITGGGTLGTPVPIGISDYTATTRGAVPSPGGAAVGRFLKDDGTWALPPASASGASGVFPFTYNTSIVESIGANELRGNAVLGSATKLWVQETTVDGLNVTLGLSRIKIGWQVYVQNYSSSTSYVVYDVTADAFDKGAYWEIGVSVSSASGVVGGGRVAFQAISAAAGGSGSSAIFTSTTQGEVPPSGGLLVNFLRADGNWAAPAGGGGGGITLDQAIDAVQGAMSATAPIVVTQDLPLQTIKYSLSGTLAQFNTACSDADFASITGAETLSNKTFAAPVLGTPASGTLTNCTGLPVTGLATTTTLPIVVGTIELGATSDTTLSRTAPGQIAVEGVAIPTISSANPLSNKTISLTSNTVTGSLAEFNTACNNADFVSLNGTETLTNKTISLVSGAGNTITAVGVNQAGIAPSPGATPSGRFLKDDGTWSLPPIIVSQPSPPSDTTVLWADTDEAGIEENIRYLKDVLTTTYTLVIGDKGKMLMCANSAPQTITVPTNASVAYVIGTQLDLVQMGTGTVTVNGASGVTVNATPSRAFRAQYSAVSLIKTATDTWLLLGDLT